MNHKLSVFLIGSTILLNHCASSGEVQMKNKEALYTNCMDTFKDEVKCKTFLDKSEAELVSDEEKRKEQVKNLSKEQLAGLKLRSDVKDTVQSQNKVFVKEYLGEPDEVARGNDREYWIYKRPITKYSPDHDPDKEVTVIFKRDRVERVNHVQAETTPSGNSIFLFKNNTK